MKPAVLIGTLCGAALFTALIVWFGFAEVMAGVAAAGWGIIIVAAFRIFLLLFDVLSWWVLLPSDSRGRFSRIFWIRWIGDSVNTLLPVARVGGEFLRAHMAFRHGVSGPVAGASVLVDVTAGVMTQFLFSIVGVAAFAVIAGGGANTTQGFAIGLALFGAGLAGFYGVQRSGPFGKLARVSQALLRGRDWTAFTGSAGALDSAVAALYQDRRALLACCFWRIAGWVTGAGEVWLILTLLGHPVTLTEAFVLESLGQAARSAGFMIPGGLGVQEGGLIIVGGFMGLTPEIALSLSLVKRARELLVGVPGLIAWQVDTGAAIWSRRNKG